MRTKTIGIYTFFVLSFAVVSHVSAQPFPAVKALVERRVPWIVSRLVLDSIGSEKGKDIFRLRTDKGKLTVAASNANAAAKGLYYFLTHYCHRSMSHLGDNLSAVKKLPQLKSPITIISPYPVRYALNYCTISYSMAFYDWPQWAHELDWMAFNGVNLMLAPIGTEIIWQKTLQQCGLSEQAIRDFIPGAAFTAWWLMGNMEGWGGSVSQTYIDRQMHLQKKILNRMQSLGIRPVLQGFYGMVPKGMKEKYPDWNIVSQGKWAGGFRRPDILLATDPHFKEVAATYYHTMNEIYGSGIQFFAGEPFHEGGITKGIDMPALAAKVQAEMMQNYPGSTWVLQGWQNNPTDQLLDHLDKKHVLIQELFGENTENWNRRQGYNNTPFIWCTVTNFGEKQGLYGKLQRFANEVFRAHNSPYAAAMQGVGIMPEGIVNNPVVYAFVLDLGWQAQKVEVTKWLHDFVKARYGADNAALQQAWQIFATTIYRSFDKYQEGPQESVFCARPSMDVGSVSSWGTRVRNYDTAAFAKGVQLLLSAEKDIPNTDTYRTDKIDFARQLLANKGEIWYADMVSAYRSKDSVAFKAAANQFLDGIRLQDALLGYSPYFTLHKWLNDAVKPATPGYDRDNLLLNAKEQITIWGPDDNPRTNLHEYAHKEWNGMMRYFYLPRWEMFVTHCLLTLRGEKVPDVDYFSFEKDWTKKQELYAPRIGTKEELNTLIKRIVG